MNYEELYDLIKQLSDVDKKASRKLFGLVYKHLIEKSEVNKNKIESAIKTFLFNEFMSLIDKKSRNDLYDINLNIAEEAHNIECKYPRWYISNYGAVKYKLKDYNLIYSEIIPREHNKGFILDKKNASVDTVNFYTKNQSALERINGYMDRKEEIISNEYQPDYNVPFKLTESLIDYLGFRRIDDKVDSNNIQKR